MGQGHGPAYLNPYVTAGKECGDLHVLATFGYNFPVGPGTVTNNTFYGTLHLDRKCGWLYPLVEFNFAYQTKSLDLNLEDRPGFFDFVSNLNATGKIATVAPGFNAVITQDKLEIGAVYQTPIASQRNFQFNEFLVKMIYRF